MKKSFKMNAILLAFAVIFMAALPAFAEEGRTIADNQRAIDTIWILVAAFLVFFMQAGFGMVEAGFTRAKNASNILMKNTMDFCCGSIAFWLFGFGLMFGKDIAGFIGSTGFFLSTANPSTPDGLWQFAFWLFQCVFAAAAATIVAGAMAERTKFSSYLLYSVLISGFIYPVVGHWIWGGGWLSQAGFIDFAGSTVVHAVGGWASLAGAIVLGPRIGKYTKDGKSKMIAGHNIPLASLGVFILWLGWFGFNPGSTLSGTNMSIATIAVTTNLSAAAGAITAMLTVWIQFGKPDISMTLNGALGGLVGVTAGCASISPLSAILIGSIAGILVVFAVEFIDKKLKVDDPVGAVAVHGICGVWGTIAVGLFAQAAYGEASGAGAINGLFFGGGASQLLTQLYGVAAVVAWAFSLAFIVFTVLKKTVGLRVTAEEEIKGLDIEEHGMESYSGFQIFTNE